MRLYARTDHEKRDKQFIELYIPVIHSFKHIAGPQIFKRHFPGIRRESRHIGFLCGLSRYFYQQEP
jgi:hypothetical protein